jgi:hypothetical protein
MKTHQTTYTLFATTQHLQALCLGCKYDASPLTSIWRWRGRTKTAEGPNARESKAKMQVVRVTRPSVDRNFVVVPFQQDHCAQGLEEASRYVAARIVSGDLIGLSSQSAEVSGGLAPLTPDTSW